MSEYKMTPKYILLTAPTLKNSRSTHLNSFNARSFDTEYKNQLGKFQQIDEQGTITKLSVVTKKMDSIRKQLTSSIQNTISQTKRNNVLKQLITILQNSNKQLEQQSKNEWKQRVQIDKKKLSKQQYELDQILQKYNEQVAKITTLREMVNSARTDRVVYSALFKKIEWQIKHYQNLYREVIVKTQANKTTKSHKKAVTPEHFQSVDEFEAKDQTIKPFLKDQYSSKNPLFVTELQKAGEKNMTKKGNTQIVNQTQNKLIGLIQETENKIDKFIKKVQCVNAEDTLKWYSQVQDQNNKLLNLIEEEQFRIEEVQNQILRINEERRISEVVEENHLKRLQHLPSTRKLRTLKIIKGSQLEEQSNFNFVLQLAKIAGIQTKNRPFTGMVIELEQRLSRLQLIKNEIQSGSIMQSGLENILSKMQRFDNCQRIFSKRQFQGQYMKELSKQRKNIRTRK